MQRFAVDSVKCTEEMISKGQWCHSGLIGTISAGKLYVISKKSRFASINGKFYVDETFECKSKRD